MTPLSTTTAQTSDSLVQQYRQIVDLLPEVEVRPGQQKMVETIEQALLSKRHLIVEAGTGLGKSFGYLIPTLLSGHKPIVVSTGTIALQEQLMNKDVPWLSAALGRDLVVRLVKGRGNYLCIHKLDELERESGAQDKALRLHLQQLRIALSQGWDGDWANLDVSLPKDVWEEVRSTHDDCLSWRCRYWDENPYRQAREALEKADLIITNHALYCQHLTTAEGILPAHEVLVLDEAHVFRQYALGALTSRIGKYRSGRLIKQVTRRLAPVPHDIVWGVKEEEAALLAWLFEQANGRQSFRLQGAQALIHMAQAMDDRLAEMADWLAHLPVDQLPDASSTLDEARMQVYRQQLATQLTDLRSDWQWFAHGVGEQQDNERVNWAEVDPRHLYFELKSTPLNVADQLATTLWPGKTAILTSATMSVNRSLAFQRDSVGLPARETDVAVLPSPFDYRRQCQLYLPATGMMPEDPNDTAAYVEATATQVQALLEVTQGRAFVLFTSYDNMRRVAEIVAPSVFFPVRVQGDLPRNRLIEWFRQTQGSVLFGTATFWEGIDIPGSQLSAVIIDKIPFTSPGDPVHEAQVEQIKRRGGNWFGEYALPLATLRLKQGVGRLIRTQRDEGILAILDPRMTSKSYGRTLLSSLPSMPVVREVSQLRPIV